MQLSRALFVLTAAGLASAQIPDVPNCSLNCFISGLTGDGCSQLTDFACHCQKPSLVDTITPCVQKACDVEDQSSVSNIVVSECSAAGHPISVPPIGAATTSAESSATTTESSSGAGSATHTSVTVTPTPTGTQTSSHIGSSSPVTSPPSSSGSATPTGSSSANHSGSVSGSASASSSESASTSPPIFTGAASNVKGSLAGIAAAAAAAAAAAML
ncbi:hypothetical protein ASPWEDRAFT_27041 [Aspergillus wentii DTO 134E9]|uniref:CFEM domain-containing protein n=1 Tax=Aspergillus wentii DTO 134E9 TaxID=1073089 RepID=A0A1L9RRU8_ASPWE|nr:uncharacterized protein ASPWEDRAFT_27041 [Aspergillus wentii DTO 134E9]KAI9930521.1 hypothetical protein MW887_011275 [Aspergillus wentii]OJJ37680.1 hypothetical protein ASPWEDRAFT_27041 [Aspergillus wentii DTO 134E9]